jgi:uncharacterized RDD family membrane protein YckC
MASAPNQFAPPKSRVEDVASDAETLLATRGQRFGGALLDGLAFSLIWAPSYAANWSAMKALGGRPWAVWAIQLESGGWAWLGVLGTVVLCVVNGMLVVRNGQSLGKKLMGIKIVRVNGERATFWRIFLLRFLVTTLIGFIPLLGSLYGLADALFIFGASKRCIHDYIADTIVIKA